MTSGSGATLNQYAQHLLDYMQLLRVYKSAKVFSLSTRIWTRILIIICFLSTFMLVFSEIIGLKDGKSAKQIAREIGAASFHSTGIVKCCYCMWKIETITSLVNMLHRSHRLSFKICQNTRDREMLHKEMEVAHKITRIFAYYWTPFSIAAGMHYCCNPISFRLYEIYVQKHDSDKVPKLLPLDGWFPWDKEKYYGYSYFIQCSGVVGCVMGTMCYDQLYVSSLVIICSQLKFLSKALQSEDDSEKVTDKVNFEERLKNCAIQHAEILKYVKELESVGSPCMFMQCVQNIIILCLCSFEAATLQITSDKDCIVNILDLLEFCSGVTVQLFFFCYVASEVSSLGVDVADAAYSCQWVSSFDALQNENKYNKRNHKVKYLVLMIIARAQRPIILTGGPFYILSLQTFKSIVGMAVSNAVVLSQVYEDQ